MIDDGTPKKGTTMRSGFRAMIGWGTCDEDLWPSNVDLNQSEFEDWRSIPKPAWDDARLKRIQNNRALVTSVPCHVLKLNGREFRLFTHCFNVLRGEDKQFELRVIDSEFETVAWATLRAYVRRNQIVLEDLFVKPEFRRMHLGTILLHRIEQIVCLQEEDFPQVHNDYANLLRRIRRPSDAETHHRRAIEIEEFPETHYGYALLLVDSKRYEEAEYHFLRALELRKEFPEADKAYAKLLSCLGRYVEAEEYYRQALENKEDYADAHADYAFLLGNLKRYKESEERYLRAIEIKEKDARWVDAGYLHGELGGMYEAQGRLDRAETHYAKVLEISIRTGHDWLHKQASHDLARVRQYLNKGNQEN